MRLTTSMALAVCLLMATPTWPAKRRDLADLVRQCYSASKKSACSELSKIASGEGFGSDGLPSNLTDQSLLATIVANKREAVRNRSAAAERLTDQTEIARLAVSDSAPVVRRAAVGRLTDASLLPRIAQSDADAEVRKAAVGKITDQSVLSGIVMQEKDAEVRFAAEGKLTEQSLQAPALAKIVMEDSAKKKAAQQASLPHTVQRFPLMLRADSGGKQGNATLVLAVFWIFSGGAGGAFEPDASQTRIAEPSGFSEPGSTNVTLLLSDPYKKPGYPSRLYFNAEGEVRIWWTSTPPPQASIVRLSSGWLSAATELPAEPSHPAGGISISSRSGTPLVFFIEFSGQSISNIGTE
jgi:hypothetical protein